MHHTNDHQQQFYQGEPPKEIQEQGSCQLSEGIAQDRRMF